MRCIFRYFCVFFLMFFIGLDSQVQANDDFDDSFKDYQMHLDGIKKTMGTVQVENISFPVQKDAHSSEVFVRKGFLMLRPQALGTVIVCHGYTQSKNDVFFFRTMFPHFNVLVFDFRAHGELTDGQYSTIGRDEIFDVKGAVDFVRTHPSITNKRIIGFGFSMGAVSLIQAQAHFKNLFDMLILDSPFASSDDCMEKGFEKMLTVTLWGKKYCLPGKKLMMKCLYSPRCYPIVKRLFKWVSGLNPNVARTKFVQVVPIATAHLINVPCFFITCENDKKVSVDCVQRLYETVSSLYKRLWITQGIKHCGSCLAQPELYSYRVNNFIKKVIAKSYGEAAKVRDDRVVIQAIT